ncbi:hypothetical protein ELY33_14655 [Vreelandella andesensis]|uniref:Uncharacterized protein n=1 Tax=Vreelandella andesensis TaxID=447567 RepID=A0A433KGM7_9GAMM|nr:hypothetical protein ELY33_14655 [Halomonas andesensis]
MATTWVKRAPSHWIHTPGGVCGRGLAPRRHGRVRSIATARVLLLGIFINFGLSQAFLTHSSGVIMYAFLLVSFWGIYANLTRVGVNANG